MSVTIAKRYIGNSRFKVGDLVEHIGSAYFYYEIISINNKGRCVIVCAGRQNDLEPVLCTTYKANLTNLSHYHAVPLR
jgi:hypothetical protein